MLKVFTWRSALHAALIVGSDWWGTKRELQLLRAMLRRFSPRLSRSTRASSGPSCPWHARRVRRPPPQLPPPPPRGAPATQTSSSAWRLRRGQPAGPPHAGVWTGLAWRLPAPAPRKRACGRGWEAQRRQRPRCGGCLGRRTGYRIHWIPGHPSRTQGRHPAGPARTKGQREGGRCLQGLSGAAQALPRASAARQGQENGCRNWPQRG